MQRITYATDTSALTSTSGFLTPGPTGDGVQGPTATGTSTAGYFAGGRKTFAPNLVTKVDKITYASDTTELVPGAALSDGRNVLAATGNTTAGYFGGGAITPGPQSRVDKLTYSNETTAYTPGANLSTARQTLAATGNSTHGYFGGGISPAKAIVDKLTYSSDTTAAAPGANLSFARGYLAATGNSTHGYFAGGDYPAKSTMDKTTFATDTTSALPGANLPIANYYHAGASARANALPESVPGGSPNTGYFAGGTPGPGSMSTVDKIDFTTDTTNRIPGANLTQKRQSLAATSSVTDAILLLVTIILLVATLSWRKPLMHLIRLLRVLWCQFNFY